MENPSIPSQNRLRIQRSDCGALALSALFGAFLSLLPHLISWFRYQDLAWIADSDNLLYLAIAAKNYFQPIGTALSDPVFAGASPVMYPNFLFLPGIWLAKLCALGPMGVNILWRAWAGLSIGAAWFLAFRAFRLSTRSALAWSLVLLCESGLVIGHPFLAQFIHLYSACKQFFLNLSETTLGFTPQWRIITPGLSLGFFILHLAAVQRSLSDAKKSRIVLAGLSFALLFYVYFYFWTAAGLALVLALLADAKNRWKYFHILWIGVLFGLPNIILSALTKSATNPEALPRIDSFLPIPHFSELLLPKIKIALLFFVAAWVWRKRREWIFLLCYCISSLCLMNHQIFTGLQISNFHWNYALGPSLCFLFLLIAREEFPRRIPSHWPGSPAGQILRNAALLLFLFVGILLRVLDTHVLHPETIQEMQAYRDYTLQRIHSPQGQLEPLSVVAGDAEFLRYSPVLERQLPLLGYAVFVSLSVSNAELEKRFALNSYLSGIRDLGALKKNAEEFLQEIGPLRRDPSLFEEHVKNTLGYFAEIEQNPLSAVDQFQVRYLALAPGADASELAKGGDWKLLEAGPRWQIWERTKN